MGKREKLMRKELQILFSVLCEGLRQEVRQRRLAKLVTGQDFSLTNEQEAGVASVLAWHLQSLGFVIQLESYFSRGNSKERPDVRIWLPASKKYIYLELKTVGWGSRWTRYYYYRPAIWDIEKLKDKEFNEETDLGNGLIALGFSKLEEPRVTLKQRCEKLSQEIITNYPYEKIGLERIDLQGMDEQTSYAMIGLWFRFANNPNSPAV